MTTRTDVLRVRLETDDNGNVKASMVGVADAADKVNKATASSADGAGKATQALKETSHAADDLTESFHGNSRAITSLQDLIDDLVSGQFGRAKRELSALANETGFLSSIMNPLGITIAAVAGSVALLTIAAIEGSREEDAYTKALINTGVYAGMTADQLGAMAKSMVTASVTQHAAAEAIQQVVASGKFTSDQIQLVASAVENAGDKADQTVAAFEKLADDPAKAIAELNQQQHFLTDATYEQIQALQEQGHTQDAATLAMKTYSDTVVSRSADMEQHLSALGTAWTFVKNEAAKAWDSMLDIGRPHGAIDKEIEGVESYLEETKKIFHWIAHPMQAFYEQQTAAATQSSAVNTTAKDAANKALEDQANQVAIALSQIPDKYRTAEQKRAQEITQIHAQANDAIAKALKANDQKLADRIKQDESAAVDAVNSQFASTHHKVNPGIAAGAALDQYVNNLNASSLAVLDNGPLTRYTQGIAKLLDEYDKAIAKGDSLAHAQADYDKGVVALTRDLDAQQKQLHDRNEAALKSYTDAMDKQNEALQQSYALQVARVGMGAKEYAQLEAINKAYAGEADQLRKVAEKQAEFASTNGKSGLSQQDAQALTDQIRTSTAQQVVIIQNGYAQMDAAQADWRNGAIQSMQDWADQGANVAGQTATLFTNAFGSMNDALVNFATTGKLNFKSLVTSIISDLARMELRVLESKILQEIIGAFVGGGVSDSAGVGTSMDTTSGDVAFGTDAVASAKGNVFDAMGLTAFANGAAFTNSVVSSPTLFRFANGAALGVMGEAGPEAVMPLTRGPDGKLGVRAAGGGGGDVYQFNNNVTISDSGTTSQTSGDDRRRAAQQLNDQMKAAALDVLNRARQPGGVLWKDRQGQGI